MVSSEFDFFDGSNVSLRELIFRAIEIQFQIEAKARYLVRR